MQSFRRARRPLSPTTGLTLLVAGVILLIVLIIRFFAPATFTALSAPLWQFGTQFGSGGASGARLAELENENEALKAELAASKVDATLAQEPGVVANVIARPPLAPYDVLVIDKGTDTGAYDGMRVYAHGVPIGVIESANRTSAKVALFSAPGKATEGWVGVERVPVTLHGAGAGAYRADLPREAAIAAGDAIYLPGEGLMPVGYVIRVETHPSAPRAVVFVRPTVNVFSLVSVSLSASPAP